MIATVPASASPSSRSLPPVLTNLVFRPWDNPGGAVSLLFFWLYNTMRSPSVYASGFSAHTPAHISTPALPCVAAGFRYRFGSSSTGSRFMTKHGLRAGRFPMKCLTARTLAGNENRRYWFYDHLYRCWCYLKNYDVNELLRVPSRRVKGWAMQARMHASASSRIKNSKSELKQEGNLLNINTKMKIVLKNQSYRDLQLQSDP
jgi:hypothetical protein